MIYRNVVFHFVSCWMRVLNCTVSSCTSTQSYSTYRRKKFHCTQHTASIASSPGNEYICFYSYHSSVLSMSTWCWIFSNYFVVLQGSPSPFPDRHLLICHPEVSRTELDPEDGLYERVSWDFWKSYKNSDGSIEDSFTVRKVVFVQTLHTTSVIINRISTVCFIHDDNHSPDGQWPDTCHHVMKT